MNRANHKSMFSSGGGATVFKSAAGTLIAVPVKTQPAFENHRGDSATV
jgi:hypothetical protein